MRLLLIDDDPRFRTLLRHHVTCEWPDVDVVGYNPAVRGRLTPGFLAQGYSAVLLDHSWDDGNGLDWLRDLVNRPGFAPVLFLADTADSVEGLAARDAGAFAVIGKHKINPERLHIALRRAAEHQEQSLARWRASAEAKQSRDFAGAVLKGYRRLEHLAKGSVSDVFLAESEAAGGVVALKVTPAIRKESGIDQSMQRFLQEFEIVQRVRHPNVVRIHDLGVTDDHLYIVMEYLARGDLRKRMAEGLTARQSLEYARDIALALQAIHTAGVLHRDLKPGNVMLRDDGTIALIDFGLAKAQALQMEITDSGLIFGTPHYMSPEQGHGKVIDARSDLYSLGIMLYEMLTGAKPYDAENPMAILYHHAKSPVPPLPPHLAPAQSVLEALLAKEPENRPASGAVAAEMLGQALAALGDSAVVA
jgi:tRNA A-37 threonylcarbamoyl transferase component Bud32/DNA-binding NarL/FixJ family response regulator